MAEVSGVDQPDPSEAPGPERRKVDRRDLDRLQAENTVLKQRLEAAETVARERQARIDDLLAALRMLPAAWAQRLERIAGQRAEQGEEAVRQSVVDTIWEEAPPGVESIEVSEPDAPTERAVPEPAASSPESEEHATGERSLDPAEMARAAAAWADVRDLRDRLDQEQLEREIERLRTRGAGAHPSEDEDGSLGRSGRR